jgi:hypothetical protein
LRHNLLVAADGTEEMPRKALAVFTDTVPRVLNEVASGEGPAMAREDAITWLRASVIIIRSNQTLIFRCDARKRRSRRHESCRIEDRV